jgi:hypothetical protein
MNIWWKSVLWCIFGVLLFDCTFLVMNIQLDSNYEFKWRWLPSTTVISKTSNRSNKHKLLTLLHEIKLHSLQDNQISKLLDISLSATNSECIPFFLLNRKILPQWLTRGFILTAHPHVLPFVSAPPFGYLLLRHIPIARTPCSARITAAQGTAICHPHSSEDRKIGISWSRLVATIARGAR